MVTCGDISIFEYAASKYLVSPAPDDGMFILLSLLLILFGNFFLFKNVMVN